MNNSEYKEYALWRAIIGPLLYYGSSTGLSSWKSSWVQKWKVG